MALRFEGVFFLAQPDQGSKGGFAFCGFFALALAAGQFDAVMMDGAFKDTVVVGAGCGDDVILRRLRGDRLQQFLKFAFGVLQRRNDRQCANSPVELAKNEFACGVKATIEKNSAEKGFKSIRQRRRALATAMEFFAAT